MLLRERLKIVSELTCTNDAECLFAFFIVKTGV
jgi:hypothetical protein